MTRNSHLHTVHKNNQTIKTVTIREGKCFGLVLYLVSIFQPTKQEYF